MIQWLRDRLGHNTTEDDEPPKPEPNTGDTEETVSVYEATIEYRNGDTDTFECYGMRPKSDVVDFDVDVEPYCSIRTPVVKLTHNTRREHYEVLAREPETTILREETYRFEWKTEWEQDVLGVWEESVDRDSIQMERIA